MILVWASATELASGGRAVSLNIHSGRPRRVSAKANPMAMVLSAAMMLRIGLKQTEAAADLEAAVDKVLAAGFRTGDLMAEGCTMLGCRAMGEQLLNHLST